MLWIFFSKFDWNKVSICQEILIQWKKNSFTIFSLAGGTVEKEKIAKN